MKKSLFCILLATVLISTSVHSQVLITELMASNSSNFTDPEFNQSADWIELFNSGSSSADISGYFLTDNLSNPTKWEFPSGTVLPAGTYLLVWADDQNSGLHANFKLAAEGEQIGLFNQGQTVVDTITFGSQRTNISYGRNTSNTVWGYFDIPTPGAANTNPIYTDFTDFVPEFTPAGGLKTQPVSLDITSMFGGTLRYTIDGSTPGPASPIFGDSLLLTENTVVRARVFQEGKLPGPVVTHTYFVSDPILGTDLPVVSIASDPSNFWDPVKGIYVQDFKPEWEIPINIEMFENRGEDRAAFNELAGTKVNGLYSWQLPQKMLGVYFRKEYGKSELDYQLFYDRSRSTFENFALRASGSDWSHTLFRDVLLQSNTQTNMNLPTMGYRQAVVFVNGEFLGIHNIRSKVDEDFVADNFDMEKGTFDLIENTNYAEAGNLDQYNHFLSLLGKDLSIQANFDAVAAEMDIENFTDYVITEIVVCNTSIGHNVMAWKPREGGKWKWILMDLDRGYGEIKNIDFFIQKSVLPLKELLQNAAYRDLFFQRLNDQVYTTFNHERIGRRAAELQSTIEPAIERHITRWTGTTSNYGDAIPSVDQWYSNVAQFEPIAAKFRDNVLTDMQNYGYEGTISLDISVQPDAAGEVTLNGLEVDEINQAAPFIKGMQITLKAIPTPGFHFVGWTDELGTDLGSNPEYTEIANSDHHVVAVFESDGSCTVPSTITSDITLEKSCSPYIVAQDVIVSSEAIVTIGPGVEVLMAEGVQWTVNGILNINGTDTEGVIFSSFDESPWKALVFENTPSRSTLSYLTIENATRGSIPTRSKAAISSFNADLTLDHLTITDVKDNPIFAKYSDIILTNSILRSYVTGDLINVKYGTAYIENCNFTGNTSPDADGIDYDEIEGGVIVNCTFLDFYGFNSDAIDIGEKARAVKIENVIARNISDKGVSVGQLSSAFIENGLFINVGKGIGIKDSSWAHVNRSTFYNCAEAISCYEKNPGLAGGNAMVSNSILANSPIDPYYSDEKSFIHIRNSLSDTKPLPDGNQNLLGDALFEDPVHGNFRLMENSPALTAGTSQEGVIPIGSQISGLSAAPDLTIVQLFADQYKSGAPEFLAIYNPSDQVKDLTGYKITRGITHTFHDGTKLNAGDTIWLSNDAFLNFDHGGIFQRWDDGHLSNEGETIQLENQFGMVIDHVRYDSELPWPTPGTIFTLKSFDLPNHLGKNWSGKEYTFTITRNQKSSLNIFNIFPNPSSESVWIKTPMTSDAMLMIFDMSGRLIDKLDVEASIPIPLDRYPEGVLIFRFGNESIKVIHSR